MVRDVLTYLVNNPDAQDTLEGIAEWWLLERKIESRAAKVKEVLAELVAKGLILERRGSDSRLRYLINTDSQDEIRALLSKEET
jgi:DNA-binding MarR family transcriptional regulator